jgi:predicted nucleotidyltransferase
MMNNLIMKCVFGSHLYRLQTENSDKDYKGIYLPTKEGLLLGNYARHYSESTGDDKSKNTKDDVDVEIFSLPYFIELACKGETVALDMLHAQGKDLILDGDDSLIPIWADLHSKRKMFYTKDMKSYIGYARKQANKYGIKGSRVDAVEKVINWLRHNCNSEYRATTTIRQVWSQLPTNEFVFHTEMVDPKNGTLRFYEVCGRKYQDTLKLEQLLHHAEGIYNEYGDRAKMAQMDLGVDWKAVSHCLRASFQMLDILKEGDFEYPLKQTQFLLNVKTGQLNFINDVQPVIDDVITEVEELAAASDLPATVDREYWDRWLLEVYENYL